MKELLNCCYELMEIELRAQHTENLFTLLHMAERIDLLRRGGIIEERSNDGHTAKKGEDGKFIGSEPYADEDGKEGNVKTDDRFDIHPDKINKFLLKPGAKHSQEFFDVGYKRDDYERLFDDIVNGYDKKKAIDFQADDKHRKDSFSIFMNLGVSSQKRFRTVWEQSREEGSKPRLITAHRED